MTHEAATNWVAPDACTLPSVHQPLRVAEFDALFATGVVRVDRRSPTSLRLVLDGPDDLADRVQDLADRETACCSFFIFALTSTPDDPCEVGRWLFDIEVPIERRDILTALADRADALRPRRAL